MTRTAFAALLALGLAACGGGGDSGKKAEAKTYTAEQNAAAVAALPAPYSTANYEAGRDAFKNCTSCHTIEAGAPNGQGPNLRGVVGTAAGTHPANFSYSAAMKNSGLTWDLATLDRFIASPLTVVQGTRMAYAGLKDEEARRNVIAFIAVESSRD